MRYQRRDVVKWLTASAASAAATRSRLRDALATPGACIQRDVCVIGGGGSGPYAAVELRKMGKSVVLLEKMNYLGGHTQTYHDPSTGTPSTVSTAIRLRMFG